MILKSNQFPHLLHEEQTQEICAVVAVQDTLGVASVSALLSGGIVGLLQKKAAGEIAKLILKVGVKNVAPVAAAASLIWSFGRCMWF
ncbi:hypothetical protein V2H06_08005 [Streptococcus uberis]|uniref:hypothetical protein n=1 Tax=Streptococcus uberis TaxID=1349 RepID=UPI001FF5F80C|nr:hypothetical protein [Streptococcus uberis]MCK1196708.1 hypothetical protein [Streptococcus uberis]MCK1218913.1 hypothetical protein [Streptococcus uberis]MCK1227554.1 hypothetical protein [Streptococcus uberis]MCK1249916.1 hypothetical protein [Streptococcus uberis]MEE3738743.1 hypothetical protein [Streptococcus uberis]